MLCTMLGGALRLSSLSPLDNIFLAFTVHEAKMKANMRSSHPSPGFIPFFRHLFCPLIGIFLTLAFASLCLRVQLFSLYYILNEPATPQAMSSNEN